MGGCSDIAVYRFLAFFVSEWMGSLTPKNRRKKINNTRVGHFLFLWHDFLVVFLGHGIFHLRSIAVLFFLRHESVSGRGLKLPQ